MWVPYDNRLYKKMMVLTSDDGFSSIDTGRCLRPLISTYHDNNICTL